MVFLGQFKAVIENGRVPGDVQEYKENDILPFQCNPRFQRSDHRPSKCTKLGLRAGWNPTPECEPITCKLQLPPVDGTEYDPSYKSVFSPGDTVTVRCGQSHWIFGKRHTSTVVSCKEDGQWSLSPVCQEVTCSNRRDPHVYWWDVYWGQQMKLGDEVRYRCRSGYKKTGGAAKATCTREGWKPDPLCQAITCDREDVANADINNPQDKYRLNAQVHYVCKDGYEGQVDRTCGENGWSGTSQCRERGCNKQDISEAQIYRNNRERYSHGDEVHYVCNKGEERRFSIVCEKGVWTGIQSCTGCLKAEVPHGFFAGPYGDKLYYTCDEGYKLVTNGWWAEAECRDRLWSGLHLCIKNNACGEVPVISNGEVSPLRSHHAEGESVTITCKTGFPGGREERLTCRAGEWTSDGQSLTTICAPDGEPCSPPPKVQNTVVVGLYQREFLSGSDVTYQCRDTFQMEGDATIRCNNGNWEKHNIVCAPIRCPVPVIENGRVPGDVQEYKENYILPFQCNPGFQPSDHRLSKCTKLVLGAEWNPTPACEPITCKLQLPPVDGTEYDPSYKSVFSPGDTVTVRCAESHWISDKLQTSTVVSCKEDGQWSLSPVCQEVTCSNQRDPHVDWWSFSGEQHKRLGDEVRYFCKSGYKKTDGAAKATCTREGWKPDPLCQAITCDREDVANADIINPQDKYRLNDRVHYVCKDGYEGQVDRTCGENGWSGTSQCRAVPDQ